uniref:Estradiol 17-beta-dehydrogenase 12 n=1 Tax=Panagrellus redivivus TaxID=6233 RepID=A0A7E4UWJ5_PANRE
MVLTAISEYFWLLVQSYLVFRFLKCMYIVSMSVYGHFIKKPMDISHLLDKWCVVTGATDGIGRAYIEELAKTRGVRKFYLIARNENKLNKVKEELIRDYKAEIKTAIFDFESTDYSTLPKELSTLDVGILVNCVGIAPDRVANFYELPHDLPSKILRVNLMSCMHMIETILPGMIERDAGVIVNVASMTGWRPLPYMSTYPASKAAISFYSDTLADEFHHTNVKVTCLIPLLVATKIASYETSEANDIFVIRPDTYARYAVNILGNFRISTGCFFHDMQIALGTLVSFWGFKQVFVPTVMLGIHKKRVESYQIANSKKE